MIGYLDTSAIVPLLVAEPGSAACRRFWDDADAVATCRIAYVEAQHEAARDLLESVWSELDIVEVDRGGAAAGQ